MSGSPRVAGARYEAAAEAHLVAHGLVPLLRNFTCRMGELDLVMRDRDTLVVVEVRARAPTRFGTALETIGPAKQRRIVQATKLLLSARPELAKLPLRFDVVAFEVAAGADHPGDDHVQWLRAAFDAA
jgi:putative endonuclease